jgi:superoxide dismutase, Fe-Mn family
MDQLSRRDAIGSLAVGVAGAVASTSGTAPALAQSSGASILPALPAFAGKYAPKPLRFDPAKLTGLSERLIRSHWENNYQGSIRALNMIEGRLALALADKDYPPVAYGGLKREELHRTGSVVLHELYFDALGGDGVAGGSIKTALTAAFGSFEAWEAEFKRTAMSLAGGSGWCILAWNAHTGSLHNYWCWDHTNGPASGVPLITLDMYEHAFHMDYGAAAAKYVDAFMRNLDWETIDARLVAARKS